MTTFANFSASSGVLQPNFPAGLAVTRINLENLRRNWAFLASQAQGFPPIGIVKADAYGHGIEQISRVLLDAGCRMLAVGSTQEGILLRNYLGDAGKEAAILPLLGVLTPEDASASITNNLLPLIATAEQAALVSAAWTGASPLPVAVKVETGMSRLGFRGGEIQNCVSTLCSFSNLRPTLLLSHFAAASDPAQDDAVAGQVAQFLVAYNALRAFWPDIAISLANSAALIAQNIHLSSLPQHIARPGLSLYGGNPFFGTHRESMGAGLHPVMDTAAPVIGVHNLSKGLCVGYGHTFTAEKDMRIAVIGAGYADGLPRSLSGKGFVCIRGERCPILGRVCMQMTIVSVDAVPAATCGDAAYLLGGDGAGAVSMDEIAETCKTVPHEIFVNFGKNPRIYR